MKLLTAAALCLLLGACIENPVKKSIVNQDSIFRTKAKADYKHKTDSIIKASTDYIDAWVAFQPVAREVDRNKLLYETTHDWQYAKAFNKLLPKYKKLGHKMDSLYKLTQK